MKTSPFLIGCATGLLTATLACDGSSTTSPPGCYHNVEVAVVTGTIPLFSWAPACGMSQLSVVNPAPTVGGSEETMWSFSVSENAPVGPRIRYGDAPVGAKVWVAPRQLVPGTRYHIHVFHTVGGDGLLGSGEADFTP